MKIGLKLICTVFAAALMLSSCTINKQAEAPRTVTVEGTGSITMPADVATVEFTLTTSGWSAKQIVTDNNTLSNRLADTIKAIGVNENDITLGVCSISNPAQQYEAKRSIIITVRNLELLPAVIDCKSGTVKLKSVEYGLNDSASTLRRARTAAVQQSQDAASLLSGASGSKIGTVLSVAEKGNSRSVSSDGKITTTSNVVVTYAIQ